MADIPIPQPKDDPKLVEQARAMMQGRFKALIEHSTDVIALFGADMTVLYDSPSIVKVMGYTPEEHVGHNVLEFLHPDEREEAVGLLGSVLEEPLKSMNFEMRVRHKDGHFVWLEVVATNMLEVPEVKAIVINYRDITARKKMEEDLADKSKRLQEANLALEESRARTQAILESMGEGVLATDTQSNIVSWNRQMEQMFGYTSAEVIGKKVSEVLKIQDAQGNAIPEEERMLNRAYSTNKKATGQYFYIRKDGTRFPAAITATPFLLGDTVLGAVSVIRDITEQLAVDAAKNEFVTLISHELRTPLTVVRWNSQELIREKNLYQLNDGALKLVKYVFQAAVTMSEIVESVLTVSKLDLNKLYINNQQVSIFDTLSHIVEEFSLQLENKNISLSTDFPPESGFVKVDEVYLKIILRTLISNATKYTPEKGVIKVGMNKEGDYLNLYVQDSGCGIPDDEKERIFTKLYRASNVKSIEPNGMGLGLFISRVVARMMGGDLWFESEVGKGTTFHLKLLIYK